MSAVLIVLTALALLAARGWRTLAAHLTAHPNHQKESHR